MIGSILGYAGQQSANKTNLKMQRETNALNKQMADEANALKLQMFERELGYNSPAEQRKMLEAAGYNPSVLYGGSNAGVSAPNIPNIEPSQAQSAQVSPYLGFSQDLAVFGQNLAALAEARKTESEKKKVDMENAVFEERMKYEFERLGLANKWQELQNRFADETFEKRAEAIINAADLDLEKKNELHMRNVLYELYGQREYEAKINQLEEQAKLWKEQGKTEITQQDLNRALGRKAKSDAALSAVQAWYTKFIAPSVKQLNESQAGAALWQAHINYETYDQMKDLGRTERGAKILKDLAAADYTEEAKRKAHKEIQLLGKDIDWYEFDKLCGVAKTVGSDLMGLLFIAGF